VYESDPLLDDVQTLRYGAVGQDEVAQPDEEELEREREALNRITMQATEYVASVDVEHVWTGQLTLVLQEHDRCLAP
jgi:threonine dehydratase